MNKQTFYLIKVLLGLGLCVQMFSFKYMDFLPTEYILKGRIYVQDIPLKNDSVYLIDKLDGEKIRMEQVKTIITDENGNYEEVISCIGYCMSGGSYNLCERKGISRKDCFLELSKTINSDSLFFLYNKKKVSIKNRCTEALIYAISDDYDRSNLITFENDINF